MQHLFGSKEFFNLKFGLINHDFKPFFFAKSLVQMALYIVFASYYT